MSGSCSTKMEIGIGRLFGHLDGTMNWIRSSPKRSPHSFTSYKPNFPVLIYASQEA